MVVVVGIGAKLLGNTAAVDTTGTDLHNRRRTVEVGMGIALRLSSVGEPAVVATATTMAVMEAATAMEAAVMEAAAATEVVVAVAMEGHRHT